MRRGVLVAEAGPDSGPGVRPGMQRDAMLGGPLTAGASGAQAARLETALPDYAGMPKDFCIRSPPP